jgi:anti-anti-sigma factor
MKLVKMQVKPGVIVMQMTGRVHMGKDCAEIDHEVEQHILRNEKRVIFDLTAVDHIDSAFIGQIVKSHSRLTKSGGTLRLAGVTGMVETVLKMTQVHNVIAIYPSAGEACRDFPEEK